MAFEKFLETAEASIFVRTNNLKKRNIVIDGKRTSVTLEPQIWLILHEVAQEHNTDIHEICSLINHRKNSTSSLASSIRVFLLCFLHAKLNTGNSNDKNFNHR